MLPGWRSHRRIVTICLRVFRAVSFISVCRPYLQGCLSCSQSCNALFDSLKPQMRFSWCSRFSARGKADAIAYHVFSRQTRNSVPSGSSALTLTMGQPQKSYRYSSSSRARGFEGYKIARVLVLVGVKTLHPVRWALLATKRLLSVLTVGRRSAVSFKHGGGPTKGVPMPLHIWLLTRESVSHAQITHTALLCGLLAHGNHLHL